MIEVALGNRTDRQIALVLFAAVFGLYLRTLAPGLLFGDSGEFQVAAWTLGLAHATGYPLYLLLGSVWQHLLALLGFSPAYALNMLSALFGALSVSLLYLTLVQWLHSTMGIRRMVALLGALFLALNPTFWSQSLIAEVYTLHTLFLLLMLNLAYRLVVVGNSETALTDGMVEKKEEGMVESEEEKQPIAKRATERLAPATLVLLLLLVVGFSFTHHAMTLMVLPTIFFALWSSREQWGKKVGTWILAGLVLLMPLLLYSYLPLRSGPAASPWYHQPLGATTLTLYQNDLSAFFSFLSGQSISVGFRNLSDAIAQLSQAWLLWRLHFLFPGVVLILLGLYALWRARNWRVLLLTIPLFLLHQIFNLFYNIGDILVYYIPLYVVGTIWLAFAVDAIGGGMANLESAITARDHAADEKAKSEPATNWREKQRAKESRPPALAISAVLVLTIFWLPVQLGRNYFTALDQSTANGARAMWEAIAEAAPPASILISNDRNEIVPLFYYQAVESKLKGITGLFPSIAPDERFVDIGATVATALSASNGQAIAEQAVYLIKEMPGLGVRFALETFTPPLVAVRERVDAQPAVPVNQPYGPLTLLGYDVVLLPDRMLITLYWQVHEDLTRDYTTTVQLFDESREKVAQNDAMAGGRYYPTSLWKRDEVLVEEHTMALEVTAREATMRPVLILIGMYEGATATMLATPLEIILPEVFQSDD